MDSDRKVIYYKADNFNLTDLDEKEFSFGENTTMNNQRSHKNSSQSDYRNHDLPVVNLSV